MTGDAPENRSPVVNDPQRTSLLASASRLLAEEGPGALTVRRIASEAGVSTMGVYSRFGGKDGVVDALYKEGCERLKTALLEVPKTDDCVRDVIEILRAYRYVALKNHTHYGIMFERAIPEFEPTPSSRQSLFDAFVILLESVDRCAKAGAVDQDSVPKIAYSLWGSCHGLVSLEIADYSRNSISARSYELGTEEERYEALLQIFSENLRSGLTH